MLLFFLLQYLHLPNLTHIPTCNRNIKSCLCLETIVIVTPSLRLSACVAHFSSVSLLEHLSLDCHWRHFLKRLSLKPFLFNNTVCNPFKWYYYALWGSSWCHFVLYDITSSLHVPNRNTRFSPRLSYLS